MQLHRWFLIVLGIGVALRVWVVWRTVLVNPDAALYIYQAKMLQTGNWHKLFACTLSYLSLYPLLIDTAHFAITDWILSAQFVSAFFSSATLIPIYFICRRFATDDIAALATLIAALNPVMCNSSGEIVKDPVYWFFLAMGFLQVINYAQERSRHWSLFWASVFLLIAAWSRIEAIVPLIATAVILLLFNRSQMFSSLLFYLTPIMALSLFLMIWQMASGWPLEQWLRLQEIVNRSASIAHQYNYLRYTIDQVCTDKCPDLLRFFLPEAKNAIWLIAFGTLLNRTLEAFFYPFIVFFALGFSQSVLSRRRNLETRYFRWLVVMGLIVLYLHTLNVWLLDYRFIMLIFIPAIPFAAVGLSWSLEKLSSLWRRPLKEVFVLVFLILLLVRLPKILLNNDLDKIVFRQIGERIADIQANTPSLIYSSNDTRRIVSLYANINCPAPPCPDIQYREQNEINFENPKQIAIALNERNYGYLLYEEKHLGKRIDPQSLVLDNHFHLLGQWFHKDTGRMFLFKIAGAQ